MPALPNFYFEHWVRRLRSKELEVMNKERSTFPAKVISENVCEISGSHGGEYEGDSLPEYSAL
jgi:hypothetical protein